jgi:hypothetical protein
LFILLVCSWVIHKCCLCLSSSSLVLSNRVRVVDFELFVFLLTTIYFWQGKANLGKTENIHHLLHCYFRYGHVVTSCRLQWLPPTIYSHEFNLTLHTLLSPVTYTICIRPDNVDVLEERGTAYPSQTTWFILPQFWWGSCCSYF